MEYEEKFAGLQEAADGITRKLKTVWRRLQTTKDEVCDDPLINYLTCLSLCLSASVASWQQHRLISSVRGKICWTVYDTSTRRWGFRAYWWTHSFQNITR